MNDAAATTTATATAVEGGAPLEPEEELPEPRLMRVRSVQADVVECTVAGVHVSVANAMRRTMLASLPVIGVPFEPYAKSRVVVSANTTDDTEQTMWYRLGNVPVHSLDPALVAEYAVVLDVINDVSGNEARLVTTADLRLEPLPGSAAETALAEDPGAARLIAASEVFPPCRVSGEHIALAELRPPAAAGAPPGALALRATFAWVPGTGAFAPCVVGYANTPDAARVAAAWAKRAQELRARHERESEELERDAIAGTLPPSSRMRESLETALAAAKHDFDLTTARLGANLVPDSFEFRYEAINRAYPFARAWRTAARMLVEQLLEIAAAAEEDRLEYWPAGAAAANGRTSVLPFNALGGVGFDVVLPGVDHTLGPAIAHALTELCFVRSRAEFAAQQEEGGSGSTTTDRLLFCAFKRFTPDDEYGVVRLCLARDDGALVRRHVKTACAALARQFDAMGTLPVDGEAVAAPLAASRRRRRAEEEEEEVGAAAAAKPTKKKTKKA
jgi:hypothetical protein